MMPSTSEHVRPGLQDPTLDAQKIFRVLLEGVSHPGRILDMPPIFDASPPGLDPAAAAVCLTLLDGDTLFWTDEDGSSPILSWLRFHCGCPVVENPGQAHFGLALAADRLPALEAFRPGTDEAPETAATVILQVASLAPDGGPILSGPGIPHRRRLEVAGLPPGFWDQRRRICEAFPLGLDIIFICGAQLAVLPRSTRVDE